MGLLGMLAAGGAVGARNASNNNVIAQNELELTGARNNMEMDREMLRQKYLDKRYTTERADAREDAKNSALLNEMNYQRTRADKISDAELTHKQKLELEGVKESGRNARSDKRIAAMNKSSDGKGSSGSGVMLPDGSEFIPNDADSKNAVNLVITRQADDIQDAYQKIYAMRLVSQAAGTPEGFRDGNIPTARNMSSQILRPRSNADQAEGVGGVMFERDPKTGKLILK